MSRSTPAQSTPWPWLLPLVVPLLAAAVGGMACAAAAAGPTRPQPPPPRKENYNPDQATCQSDHLARSFQEQLKPWADQPESVQVRLRALQAEMLRASLNRCVGLGLLSPAEATSLEQRLLPSPAAQPSGQRP
jgi:hypothetical protein